MSGCPAAALPLLLVPGVSATRHRRADCHPGGRFFRLRVVCRHQLSGRSPLAPPAGPGLYDQHRLFGRVVPRRCPRAGSRGRGQGSAVRPIAQAGWYAYWQVGLTCTSSSRRNHEPSSQCPAPVEGEWRRQAQPSRPSGGLGTWRLARVSGSRSSEESAALEPALRSRDFRSDQQTPLPVSATETLAS